MTDETILNLLNCLGWRWASVDGRFGWKLYLESRCIWNGRRPANLLREEWCNLQSLGAIVSARRHCGGDPDMTALLAACAAPVHCALLQADARLPHRPDHTAAAPSGDWIWKPGVASQLSAQQPFESVEIWPCSGIDLFTSHLLVCL